MYFQSNHIQTYSGIKTSKSLLKGSLYIELNTPTIPNSAQTIYKIGRISYYLRVVCTRLKLETPESFYPSINTER